MLGIDALRVLDRCLDEDGNIKESHRERFVAACKIAALSQAEVLEVHARRLGRDHVKRVEKMLGGPIVPPRESRERPTPTQATGQADRAEPRARGQSISSDDTIGSSPTDPLLGQQ
ncbi:unnamed protein product [Vitrella brassicaformis CCMP3155]|uniref:Uncharacterized protein n=1 Tax=Vitrella brassicaformis (strain CCMP3155) TaxID=1169540 RepID=A0A0G4G1G2_VITBC|nr:unnamed protein product [Vitrella brassicaformis CCMP3155]|eukprot:CEM21694.1 unnamed protein product [Vitrella brassicaformis CCMP3155]